MRSHYLALLLPLLIFGCESKIIVSVNAPNKSSAVSSTDTATSSATETVVLSTKGGSVIVGASAFAQTADIALGEGSIASFLESAGLPSTTVVDAGPIKLSSLVSGTSTPIEPQSAINVRVNVSSKQSLGADTSAVIVVTDKNGKAKVFYVRHDSLKIETDAQTGQRYVYVGSIKSGNFAVALVSGLSSELLASKFTSLPADGDVSQANGMNPTAGAFLASTSVGETQFTLNWSAGSDIVTAAASLQYFVCSGPSSAAIDSVEECEAASSEMAYVANTLTLTITGKSASTTYYYNVVVKDVDGNRFIYDGKSQATTTTTTTQPLDTTPPAAASTLSWQQSSPYKLTSVTAAWTKSNATDLANQKIQFYTGAACNTVNGSLIDLQSSATQLRAFSGTDATTYTYKITSIDTAANSTVSGCSSTIIIDTIPPAAATGLAWSESTPSSSGTVTASWTKSLASDLYNQEIQFYADSSCGSLSGSLLDLSSAATQTRSFSAANGTYTYKVTSDDNAGNQTASGCSSTMVINSTSCPTSYVAIPANTNLGNAAFCVMKYEAKIFQNSDGLNTSYNSSLVAESRASGTPWVQISRTQARSECQALGANYDLISNAQWQAISHNIESAQNPPGTYLNWSNGVTSGANAINRGNSDNANFQAVAAGSDGSPCYAGGSGCISNTSSDFAQKRTHALSNGEIIWDIAGNVWEWVKDNSNFNYNVDTVVSSVGATDGNACVSTSCTGPQGYPKTAFGPSGTYSKTSGVYGGLGTFHSSAYPGGTIQRGGYWEESAGWGGIFSAAFNIGDSSINSTGFRCVYNTP